MEILNIKNDKAELILHGIVGAQINGSKLANKLQALKEIGVKKVTERINSRGGSIVDGYSIVAANLNLTASGIIVETINEGVSDSMASVILASGTKGYRKANDYSSAVVHNPLYGNKSLNDMEDGPIKEMLTGFKNSLMTIYAAAIGKSKEEISETMNKETLLNAEKMKQFGIIDEIILTNINLPINEKMSLEEVMNVYDGLETNINKNKKMERLNNFYNLSKDASEDSLLEAAKAEREKFENATAKVNDLEKELELKNKELEKYQDEAINMAVNAAIDSGKFDKKDKENLIENAKSIGLDNFNAMIEKMLVPHVDINAMIDGKKAQTKKDEKKYEDYSERELIELKASNPEQFEALYNDFTERD